MTFARKCPCPQCTVTNKGWSSLDQLVDHQDSPAFLGWFANLLAPTGQLPSWIEKEWHWDQSAHRPFWTYAVDDAPMLPPAQTIIPGTGTLPLKYNTTLDWDQLDIQNIEILSSRHPSPKQAGVYVCQRRGCPVRDNRGYRVGFTSTQDLIDHWSQTHGDPSPHICQLCGMDQHTERKLKHHYDNVHPICRYRCLVPGCELMFETNKDIAEHLSKHSILSGLSRTQKWRYSLPPGHKLTDDSPIRNEQDLAYLEATVGSPRTLARGLAGTEAMVARHRKTAAAERASRGFRLIPQSL